MASPLLSSSKPTTISPSPLFLLLLLLLLLQAPPTVLSDYLFHICDATSNYTTASPYASNLNSLLPSLSSSNASAAGFSTATRGSIPDQVHGLILCRGDQSTAECRSCLAIADQDAHQFCPYNRAAAIWYDGCLLRYSNQNFLSSTDNSPVFLMLNSDNATDPDRFDGDVKRLLGSLSRFAAYNTSRRFATGEEELNSTSQFPRIYGLVQCTRDLSADQCADCLKEIMGMMAQMAGKIGGRVIGVRCNFRYEVRSFSEGKSMLQLRSASVNGSTAPPRIAPATVPAGEEGSKKNKTGTFLAIIIPLVTALILISLIICICFWRRRSTNRIPNEANPVEIPNIESLLFDLSTLRTATTNFSDVNKLGQGGFGAVYKGLLPDGREIAVKRLSANSGQGLGELKNELVLVAKLQHKNLVRLLGVCLEEQEKLLVYEYVPNRSLDTILFDPIKRPQLDWGIRYKIIGGIARGLMYLHEDSQLKIIHRDLKASNILLDADMNPKISDFGLARLFGGDQTQENTSRVVGTFGYMAPEYVMHGQFSTKSDTFSFGVLVLEIMTAKKNNGFSDSEGAAEDLLSYIWEHWISGEIIDIVDPFLGARYPRSEVLRCIQIGLLCVQEDPSNRPNMSTVVLMLNSYSVSVQAPSRPAFCGGKSGKYSDISRGTQDHVSSKSIPMSPNEVSLSELEPR